MLQGEGGPFVRWPGHLILRGVVYLLLAVGCATAPAAAVAHVFAVLVDGSTEVPAQLLGLGVVIVLIAVLVALLLLVLPSGSHLPLDTGWEREE